MDLPKRAGDFPIAVELKKGKIYAWCSCGLSENQPFCDGKHKETDFTPIVKKAEATEIKYFCVCKQTRNGPLCDGSHKN